MDLVFKHKQGSFSSTSLGISQNRGGENTTCYISSVSNHHVEAAATVASSGVSKLYWIFLFYA